MRVIPAEQVIETVARAAIDAAYVLGDDVTDALKHARDAETSPRGREILGQILENAAVAREGTFPICQDTGLVILFVEMGEEARVEGGLHAALSEGVRRGTSDGFLRRTVCDPFTRRNTGDGAPAVIHCSLVPGDRLSIDFLAKGGGSENMSRVAALTPGAGEDGVLDFIVETARIGAVNACPPLIVAVGIGGNLEVATTLAKKCLTRRVGEASHEPHLARLESLALDRINRLGIGPGGLGGRTTALAVHAALVPCHIASLPVAVVLECHAHRHRRVVL